MKPAFINGLTEPHKNFCSTKNFIKGPTNYAHLKGSIDGVEKEIHLFFDKHFELDEQTECESFNSIDISHYFYKLIKESNVKLDFFMEIGIEYLEDKNISNKREIYIKEVMKLFKSEFLLKESTEVVDDIDVLYSKTNSNVKLHYFDIRDHLDIYTIYQILNKKISTYINLLKKNSSDKIESNDKSNDENISKIIFYMDEICKKVKVLTDNIKDIIANKKNNIIYNKIDDKQKYYLNKIINQYQNEILGKKINSFINTHTQSILLSMDSVIVKIQNIFQNLFFPNINATKLKKYIDEFGEYILQLYSIYTDGYLLRRILDKNYVGKSIVYSGGAHSVNFIFFLVKYYNWNILTIHNAKEKDINSLVEKINDEDYSYDIYELFLLKKIYIQCIHHVLIDVDVSKTMSNGLGYYLK
jgi:hypothetical protein